MWLVDEVAPALDVPLETTNHLTLLLAGNANEWTFEGTNTWLIRGSAGRAAVVDPGPDDPAHLAAICGQLAGTGHRLDRILLTHRHNDHAAAVPELVRKTRATVHAWQHPLASASLHNGQRLDFDDVQIEILATPGHTSDGICIALLNDRVILTGDTVLARVNPVIGHPDGGLADMLASLHALRDRVDDDWTILPGHGPGIRRARTFLESRITSRNRRIEQVRELMDQGHHTAREITAALYDGALDTRLIPAAEMSIAAVVHYLKLSEQKGSKVP